MKAFIQLTNSRSCLLRADEIKADYERDTTEKAAIALASKPGSA